MDGAVNKSIPALLVFVVGCLVAVGVLYLYWWPAQERAETSKTYTEIISENPDFAAGEELRLSGDYGTASAKLEQALASAKNSFEEGVIKLRLAIATQQGSIDNKVKAARMYKEIAATDAYSSHVRAYAVFNMSSMITTSAYDPVLMSEVFKDPPYVSMLSSDKTLTNRKLAEYASSFYPIAAAEYDTALWYARRVHSLKQKDNPDEEKIAEYVAIIHEKVQSGDRDLSHIKQEHDNYAPTLPYILLQRAKVLGLMDVAGETSLGSGAEAFEETLSAYASYLPPGSDAFARFYYALYLFAKKAGQGDVVTTLSPLYENSVYAGRNFETYLKNALINDLRGTQHEAEALAGVDPGFKSYLLTLGWKESDF